MFHRPKPRSLRYLRDEAAALSELHLTQPNISLAWMACEMLMKLGAEREGFRRE
jgi:hypothetical protein